MTSPTPLLYNTYYHIYNRGVNRGNIFFEEHNYEYFLKLYFSNFFNAYAKGINQAYHRTGSLFQHPFGRVLIKTDRQFWNVIRYIHQNPQKHGFTEDFRAWKYSSYGIILADKPPFLHRDMVLDWFGGRYKVTVTFSYRNKVTVTSNNTD